MPASAYSAYARTVDHYAVRLHAAEVAILRAAADAVFFAEDDRDHALAAACALIAGPLAHEDRLGPDAAETLMALLESIHPVMTTA